MFIRSGITVVTVLCSRAICYDAFLQREADNVYLYTVQRDHCPPMFGEVPHCLGV